MKKHTFLERLLGRHQWRETNRSRQLFDIVNYICLTCGERKERWEHPDRNQFSLDPLIRAKQEKQAQQEVERELERLRTE